MREVAVDILKFSAKSRSWALLVIMVVGLLALLVGAVVKLALPWTIYPFV